MTDLLKLIFLILLCIFCVGCPQKQTEGFVIVESGVTYSFSEPGTFMTDEYLAGFCAMVCAMAQEPEVEFMRVEK